MFTYETIETVSCTHFCAQGICEYSKFLQKLTIYNDSSSIQSSNSFKSIEFFNTVKFVQI